METEEGSEQGCIAEGGADGCTPETGLDGAAGAAVSPDGANVYVPRSTAAP